MNVPHRLDSRKFHQDVNLATPTNQGAYLRITRCLFVTRTNSKRLTRKHCRCYYFFMCFIHLSPVEELVLLFFYSSLVQMLASRNRRYRFVCLHTAYTCVRLRTNFAHYVIRKRGNGRPSSLVAGGLLISCVDAYTFACVFLDLYQRVI